MKISIFSLIIAITVAILSLLQFERFQNLERATEAHIKNLAETLNQQVKDLQQDVSRVAKNELAITQQHSASAILYSEINYLTDLTEINLHTTGDIDTTVQLLKLIETKLQSINSIQLSGILQTLVANRTALQSIQQPNITAIWEEITKLMQSVSNLQIRGIKTAENEPQITPPHPETNQNWKQALAENWQEIKNLVRIRHHSKPIGPILSDTETQLAKQNLFLLLEQLRLAVLQKNQTLFDSLLKECTAWLDDYFETLHPQSIAIQNTLTHLEHINLKPTEPDLQPLLTQLRSIKD